MIGRPHFSGQAEGKHTEFPSQYLSPDIPTDIPKGTDLNKLSNVNQNSESVNDAIGVGAGAAGVLGGVLVERAPDDRGLATQH